MKYWALIALVGISGCVAQPHQLDVSKACDSSYIKEKNPDKYYAGYRRYSSCAKDVAAGNDLRQQAWDNATARREAQFQNAPVYAPIQNTYSYQAPPQPPASAPIPFPQETSTRPKTWGDTPYAPMIAPVMRDQPVTSYNPMVPPAAY